MSTYRKNVIIRHFCSKMFVYISHPTVLQYNTYTETEDIQLKDRSILVPATYHGHQLA